MPTYNADPQHATIKVQDKSGTASITSDDYTVTIEDKVDVPEEGTSYTYSVVGQRNYTGTYTGTWTIKPLQIEAYEHTDNQAYNGSQFTSVKVLNNESIPVIKGDDVITLTFKTIENEAEGINAGTYNLKIRLNSNYIWDDKTKGDKDASCTINKINLVVTSLSSTKDSDGKLLMNDDYSLNGTVLKNNKISVLITGSISEIGEVPNTIEKVIIRDNYSKDVTSNYDITIKEGTLTIIK